MERYLGEFEADGFEGVDADLETSLFEYGMAWVKGINGHEKDYHFIYGVRFSEKTGEYNSFDWADIPIDCDPVKEWNFVNWDNVCSFVGMKRKQFLSQPLPFIVYDLVTYYGWEDIFGSSYYPFEIGKEEE